MGRGRGRGPPPSPVSKSKIQFKKYALEAEKTFDSLFFKKEYKEKLLRTLHDFQEHEGKFAIEGFPDKFGLCLYGPPGTGKTSIIKALAAETGRHVISVNLNWFDTNTQLRDLFFDLEFKVIGESMPLKFDYKDVIFVLEEVDRTKGDIIRGDERRRATVMGRKGAKGRPSTGSGGAGNHTKKSTESNVLDAVKGTKEKFEKWMGDNEDVELSEGMLKELNSLNVNLEKMTKNDEAKVENVKAKDQLDLQGLLQIFDGVVGSPKRMVVMTTNVDPEEHFDPALIRPGRINWCMKLDYMKDVDVFEEMVMHYMQLQCTAQQRTVAEKCLTQGTFSGAMVEQLCVDKDSIDKLLESMCELLDDDEDEGGISRTSSGQLTVAGRTLSHRSEYE